MTVARTRLCQAARGLVVHNLVNRSQSHTLVGSMGRNHIGSERTLRHVAFGGSLTAAAPLDDVYPGNERASCP